MNESLKSTVTPRIQRVYATAEESEQARHPALVEFDRMVGAASLQALQRYGCEPLDREVAAAHEAGHAIVALAVGHASSIKRLVVKRAPRHESPGRGEAWLGRIYIPDHEHEDFRQAARAGDRWTIVREAAFLLAGMSAECVVGRGHPSSSVEDRMRAQVACQVVAALELGATPELVWSQGSDFDTWLDGVGRERLVDLTTSIFAGAGAHAMFTVRENRKPFDRLRHKLMTHERLGWGEIAPLVEDLQLVPLGVK